jgi:hypothetical protein
MEVEFEDKDSGLVDLDKGKEPETLETVETTDGVEYDTDVEIDDTRAAIYQKYAEKRNDEFKPDVPEPDVDEEVEIKVNGKIKSVLKSKIDAAGGIDAYQKNAAASERLNQVAESERALQVERAKVEQAREFLLQQARDLDNKRSTPAEVSVDIKDLAKKYHEAFMEGEMDVANDLFLKIQEAQKATPEIKEDIAAEAVRRARQEIAADQQAEKSQRFALERDTAVQAFLSEDTFITRDPNLLQMVDVKTSEIQREHPSWEPAKIIDEAVKLVSKWVSGVSKAAPDKMAAKRNIDVVRGGSARAVPAPAPRVQTSKEYVESLRKARGLE